MTETVSLTLAHWLYLLGIVSIFVTMICRTTVVVPAVLATFLVAFAHTGSLITAFTSLFNASLVAAGELFNIFLIIALMTSLLGALKSLGSDVKMIMPFQKVMVNGHIAFVILAVVTYSISLFFWPTPAVPLVGAILIPAAIAAGLPAMGALLAIAIAGQGMALSSDYIIQVAPGISAQAAGVETFLVADRTFVLSLITGAVALGLGYWKIRGGILAPNQKLLEAWSNTSTDESGEVELESKAIQKRTQGTFPHKSSLASGSSTAAATEQAEAEADPYAPTREKWSKFFSIMVPVSFLVIVAYMVTAKFSDMVPGMIGGDGAALVGGVAALILLFATWAGAGRKFLSVASDHVTDGLVFAFKAMGAVLPIAGFFFIGNDETVGAILGLGADETAPAFLFDLVHSASWAIPDNSFFVAISLLLMGMITGADGSGFSGLPLTGALAGALGQTVGTDAATLASIGQMGAIWTGGGTLVAWSSLIAVAGFARVPVLEAVRTLFIPVFAGLLVATVAGVMIW